MYVEKRGSQFTHLINRGVALDTFPDREENDMFPAIAEERIDLALMAMVLRQDL